MSVVAELSSLLPFSSNCFQSLLLIFLGSFHHNCRYSWGRATLVLAQNCSSAIVALDFPRNRPCGYSSAVLGLIQLQIPVDLVSLRCNLQHLKTYIYLISLSIPYRI